MKHIRKVTVMSAATDLDIPALVKASADAVAVLAIGIPTGKLVADISNSINSQTS